MKFGFWQFMEILSVVLGMMGAYRNHGKTVAKKEYLELLNRLPPQAQSLFHNITWFMGVVFSLYWILNAWLGGAMGPFFIAYAIGCGIMWQASHYVQSNEARLLAFKSNVYRAGFIFTIFNILLYYAGFWTHTMPTFPLSLP